MSIESILSLESTSLHLHPDDPLVVATRDLPQGTRLALPDGTQIRLSQAVPAGHKLALRLLAPGEVVLRYGQRIGVATAPIQPGDWIHTHNLEVGSIGGDYSWQLIQPRPPQPTGRTFMGYQRRQERQEDGAPEGRLVAGTRNYIAIISTVNCSAHVASQVARYFTPDRLADYPNVDGVVAITHHSGCSMPWQGLSHTYLKRTLANLARNPNVGGAVYVGLGCEVNQLDDCQPAFDRDEMSALLGPGLVIQEQGGFNRTVRAGIEAVEAQLPSVNAIQRQPVPLSALTLGLECGGSDSWSGVTANPLVGRLADLLVAEGAAAVLAETPEIFGAEQVLLGRVAASQVGQKLADRFDWWLAQTRQHGVSVDNNPSPGNKLGGLTTILEKSLGAAAKGGSTPLTGVYEYAEWIDRPGLGFMDTPGNDVVSITGMLAGGCNLVIFTTGRGSVFGGSLAPTLKIATNSQLYQRMPEDMDFNAGVLLEGASWEGAAGSLLDEVVRIASGKRSCSEQHGLPEAEFVPWQPDMLL